MKEPIFWATVLYLNVFAGLLNLGVAVAGIDAGSWLIAAMCACGAELVGLREEQAMSEHELNYWREGA